MTPRRVVRDTKLCPVRTLFRSGHPVWLRDAWQNGRIKPLAVLTPADFHDRLVER